MELKCVIIDDELLSVEVLEGILSKMHNLVLVATFCDPIMAVEYLLVNKVGFVFLNAEMPSLHGIDLLRSVKNPPFVVVLTTNENYAIEGFELNVVDYLLKPLSLDMVVKSINKVIELIKLKVHSAKNADYIFLKENKRFVRINFSDILFVESMKDYVKIVSKDKSVISKHNLSNFERLLNPNKFIRVHKSYIVSLDHIEAFSSSEIEIGRFNIPIGRTYKDNALKYLAMYSE